MHRVLRIVSLPAALAILVAGCSSSRHRTDLGAAPTPPTPVYREPVERPYQLGTPTYHRPPLPSLQPNSPAPTGSRHIVQPGETLYGVSRRYNVSVASLIQANRLPSIAVNPGQSLIIPR